MIYTYTDHMAHVNELTAEMAAWVDVLCTACEDAGDDMALESIRFDVGAYLVGWTDARDFIRSITGTACVAGFDVLALIARKIARLDRGPNWVDHYVIVEAATQA